MNLREAIGTVSREWRPATGDTNLLDVIFQAHRIAKTLAIQVPINIPPKDTGVRLVEIVDRELIEGDLIRTVSPEELAMRATAVIRAIDGEDLLSAYEATVKYIVALYTWHGCI